MKQAKDYIIFPLDVPSEYQARHYVERLAEHVGLFKVGLELFIRCGPDIIHFIHQAGAAGVFLDLKLHDIPATVARAMAGIADLGVRFTTVHCAENQRMLTAAVAASGSNVHILGVTVLTSVDSADIKNAGYQFVYYTDITRLVLQRARMAHKAGFSGVICGGSEVASIKEACGDDFLTITPGIRPRWAENQQDDQQRIAEPAQAVQNGSDYLVIGRPIRDAADPVEAAKRIADEIAAVI